MKNKQTATKKQNSQFSVRPAKTEDIDALVDICRKGFPDLVRWQIPRFLAKKSWEHILSSAVAETWVFSVDSKVAGLVTLILNAPVFTYEKRHFDGGTLRKFCFYLLCPKLFFHKTLRKIHLFISKSNKKKYTRQNNSNSMNYAWIEPIAVAPDMRKKGIATRLLELCYKRTVQLKMDGMKLVAEPAGREYILQSYVPAANFSLSLCSQNGEIIAFTLNRKILSFGNPFSTKGMLEYNNNEQVIDIGKRLISAMKWDGVADVDFLIDNRDQKAKILEFNPRFWQTLLGGLTAGVNFPLIWCLSALGIKQSSKQHTTTKYVGSPLLFIKMMFSKLIGKHAIISARWYESCFQFICNDPLPELIEVLRRMGRRKWLPLRCFLKRKKSLL